VSEEQRRTLQDITDFLSVLTSCFRDEIKTTILLDRDLYFLLFGHPWFSCLSSTVYHASRESDCNHVKLIKWMFFTKTEINADKNRHRKTAPPIADEEELT